MASAKGASGSLTTTRYKTSVGELAGLDNGGSPDKPLILLLHSIGTSKRMYRHIMSDLAEFHCVAVDIAGHGDSDKPGSELTIPDHAECLQEVIASIIGPRKELLVAGCSLGGLLTIELAATLPSLVTAALVNGAPGWHLESQRMGRLKSVTGRLIGPDGSPKPEAEISGTVVPPDADERTARKTDLNKCGRWFLSTMWAISAYDPMLRLPKIRATTTVLMGDKDWHVPTSYVLADGIAGAKLEFIENAGHLTPFDAGEEFAASVRRLYSRHSETRRG